MRTVTYVAPGRRKETDSVPHVFSQLREGLKALGVPEVAAVLVPAFLLDGDAESFYDSLTMTGTRSRNTNRTYTWPYVVHSLITSDILRTRSHRTYTID